VRARKLSRAFWRGAPVGFNLANGGEARYAEGLYVSGDFFQLLGVKPYLGRTLVAEDDDEGCGHVAAVISNAFWQREFGSDPGVVGRNISIDGHQIQIIGVTGPAFFGVEVGNRYDVAIPLCADRLLADGGRSRIPIAHAWWLSLMGRLKPGWTSERATAHLATISPGIMQATLPPMYKPDLAKGYLANKTGLKHWRDWRLRIASRVRAFALAAHGNDRPGPADRLRESRQSPAGSGEHP
jgi:hypothetical protein